MTQTIPSNTFGVAKWIVDASASQGTHINIQPAIDSASSGDTIFIRPGTYAGDLTLKAGVNLVAFPLLENQDSSAPIQVMIVGKMTATFTGTVSVSGIRLQTNSDFFLVNSGSNNTRVNLQNCFLDCLNNTGISFTNSNSSSAVQIFNSEGNIGANGSAYFSGTSTGSLRFEYFTGYNASASSTLNTLSNGSFIFYWSQIDQGISLTSTSLVYGHHSVIGGANASNSISLTTVTGGSSKWENCTFNSGTASSISIGAGTTVSVYLSGITSLNTNAITGAGTLNYSGIAFSNSSTMNVTTQTGGTLQGGVFQAPSAGFLGEQIRATIASGSALTLSNTVVLNLTSITLTAGIWDISAVAEFLAAAITGTTFRAMISTTVGGNGTDGDSQIETPTAPTAVSNNALTIPALRVTITASTTYYLNVQAAFTVGTLKGFGRISATRVG